MFPCSNFIGPNPFSFFRLKPVASELNSSNHFLTSVGTMDWKLSAATVARNILQECFGIMK